MIFSKPGGLKLKAAEELGCFCVFIAFAELKTSPVSVFSVKSRAVCCAPGTVSTWGCLGLGARLLFSGFQSAAVLAVCNGNLCFSQVSGRLEVLAAFMEFFSIVLMSDDNFRYPAWMW